MARRFNTFALKLKVHCQYCARELKKELLNIKGVRSVTIDQEVGKVVISGKVDPAKILSRFENEGREAEFWCEQDQPRKDTIAQSEVTDPLNDPDIMAQLEKFSDNSSVKSVEVTKSIKVTYEGDSRDGLGEKNVKNTHDQVLPHDHSHCGGGGGLCAASSSCCGGHSAISHNLNHGCCHYGNTTSYGPCAHGRSSCYYHGQYGNSTGYGSCYANSISPSEGPIWANDINPTAPPLPDDYYQALPSSATPNDFYQAPQQPPSSAMPDDYYQAPPSLGIPHPYYSYQAPPSSSAMSDDYYQAPPSLGIPHPYYSSLSENVNGCIIL